MLDTSVDLLQWFSHFLLKLTSVVYSFFVKKSATCGDKSAANTSGGAIKRELLSNQ